jgi:hypothetical protein
MLEKGQETASYTKICYRKKGRKPRPKRRFAAGKRAGNGVLNEDLLPEKGRKTVT